MDEILGQYSFFIANLATTDYHTMPCHVGTETRRYMALPAQLIGRLNRE